MIADLLKNLHIEHDPRESGWLRVSCPFCRGRDPGKHYAAFRNDTGLYFCWRCGRHPAGEALAILASIPLARARAQLREYRAGALPREAGAGEPIRCELPQGTGPLMPEHRRYLERRGFDPDEIIRIWGVRGTGPLADLKWRLIIPVYISGVLRSWQARGLLDSQQPRYLSAPPGNGDNIKSLLYGVDLVIDSVVVVEGVTDAWRIGPGAVAVFGVGWTRVQAVALAQYQRMTILFDAEEEAQVSARRLAAAVATISGRDVEVLEPLAGDPAEMNKADVAEVRNRLA